MRCISLERMTHATSAFERFRVLAVCEYDYMRHARGVLWSANQFRRMNRARFRSPRHNSSIVHRAEELFLHKNTLQNRLNKIADKTGYNPRRITDFTPLTMAFLLRRYLKR